MRWEKIGQIYRPSGPHEKLVSHAANPMAVPLNGDLYRVYYSGRDIFNRSSVGCIDVDINDFTVVHVHDKPVFEYGPPGSFYARGVSLGNFITIKSQRYVFFMGWGEAENGHWRGDVGVLKLGPDFSLSLERDCPLLCRNSIDPLSTSYPWVSRVNNGLYRMWYGSTVSWDAGNGEMLHVIHHADSVDGIEWFQRGTTIPFSLEGAQAFSRPNVIIDRSGQYHMWFSYRGAAAKKYRMGYAISDDGEKWTLRNQEVGLDVSLSGWDSEMIEYPFVFCHRDQWFMFYNGNGYGKTGIGLARLETGW